MTNYLLASHTPYTDTQVAAAYRLDRFKRAALWVGFFLLASLWALSATQGPVPPFLTAGVFGAIALAFYAGSRTLAPERLATLAHGDFVVLKAFSVVSPDVDEAVRSWVDHGFTLRRRDLQACELHVRWSRNDESEGGVHGPSHATSGDVQSLPDQQGAAPAKNETWIAHAYPLQQLTIRLQGTRHSDKATIVGQLETVVARLTAGDTAGQDHDDDFGYAFEYNGAAAGPSFFDEPCGSK